MLLKRSSWMLGRGKFRWRSVVAESRRRHRQMSTMPAAAKVFEEIVGARRAAPSFDSSRPVPDTALASILQSTLKAPSSFNVQPFKCVLVKDKKVRKDLAYCFSGYNIAKVLQAPVTAVFLADARPSRSIGALLDREKERGMKDEDLSKLFFDASFLAGSTEALGRAASSSLSRITQMPSVTSAEAWGSKNTMPAAMMYMLAAASHGLDTCPMEGLDGRRVCDVVGAPDGYCVPVAIATGYARASSPPKEQWRYDESEMFFVDRFDDS